MKKLRKNKKGFTLVEVVVVLVIIAILIAIAVPAVMKYVDDANDAKLEAQARGAYIAAETAIVKDYADNGTIDVLPNTDGFNTAITNDIGVTVKVNVLDSSKKVLVATSKPNEAKFYEVTIGSKKVTIEKNGKVTVE